MSFGTADHLTSFSAGKEFFDKVQASDKTFREWADAYHERMQSEQCSFMLCCHDIVFMFKCYH